MLHKVALHGTKNPGPRILGHAGDNPARALRYVHHSCTQACGVWCSAMLLPVRAL